LLTLLPYFAVLSLLALRREVLIEAGVGMLVLIFIFPKRDRIVLRMTGLILACAITIAIATSERWQDRLFTETRNDYEMGQDARTILLKYTPAALMDRPLLGHGPGSYAWTMWNYSPLAGLASRGIEAHNSFSRAAVETGTLGLIGFTVMFVALCWKAVRRRREIFRIGILPRLTAIMIFLHVGDWLFFGDGIGSNTTWYFIGVLLYLDRGLFRGKSGGLMPGLGTRMSRHQY
jgi:O-antigen ligase